MKYDPEKHHRRSIRLKGYNYSQPGAYFITIVTQDRECLFGEVVDGGMRLNDAGYMVCEEWNALPNRFPNVDLDAFIVMPNHIHGIIIITDAEPDPVGAGLVPAPNGATPNGATTNRATTNRATTRVATDAPDRATGPVGAGLVGAGLVPAPNGATPNGATTRVAPTLGDIVGALKSVTTVRYIQGVKQSGWPPFRGRLWQRNYYEHIIRDEESLHRIQEYIVTNPAQWETDRENPQAIHGISPENKLWHV